MVTMITNLDAEEIAKLNEAAQVELMLYLLNLQSQEKMIHHDLDIKKLAPAHHGKD